MLLEDMFRQLRHFDAESPPPIFEFNHLLQNCIPKKVFTSHKDGVACQLEDTRSLSLKNTDNKVICKAVAYAIMPVIAASAASPQGGFIHRRFFTNNIVIIETVCRIYSNFAEKYGSAIVAFFDCSNAFPSVLIQWIFLVLK